MKDKRWAKISAFVGVLGGPLALFFALVLLAAGIGASRDGAMVALALLVTTFAVIFFVALKSARYYKKTGEIPYWITKIFLLAASLGVIATLPVLVSYIPGLTGINDVTLQIGGMGSVLIITGGVSGLLGLISGAGYLISLNRFDS